MKYFSSLIILLVSTQLCFSQFYVSSGSQVYVSQDGILYSNESIENNGTINLKHNSTLIIDADFVNNEVVVYKTETDKATLQIGSGEPTSNQPQDIQFNPDNSEEVPSIILNKVSETASISRGNMRLLESFVSISGTLDANSYINPSDASTDPGRVYGLTFANPDIANVAQVDESSGGAVLDVLTERFIPAGDNTKRAYRLLTSAVNSFESINANWQEGATTEDTTPNPNPGFGIQITGGPAADGFDQSGSGNPSMFTFDNSFVPSGVASQLNAWSALPDTNSKTLKAGEAYLTFVRGDRSIDLTSNSSAPTNTTLRSIGDLHIGPKTFSTSNNATNPEFGLSDQVLFYSLVGNPYQAIVDFTKIELVNIDPSFHWVWDPNVGTRGNYVTVETIGTTVDSNNSNSQANQYIQPGQSFFVQTMANGAASMTFNENDKNTSAGAVTVFSEQNNDPSISLLLYSTNAYNSGNRESDGLKLKFEENSNNNVDAMDAEKLLGSDENLARIHGDELLSIERRAMPENDDILPLSTLGYTEDNYTFVADATNIQDNFDVYLLDTYSGIQTPLNEGATAVSFSVDTSIPDSIAEDRFSLVFDNTTLSTQENAFGAGFSLYPNPTPNGLFSIKTPGLSGEVNVQMTNMLGQLVSNQYLNVEGQNVNVLAKNLSTGVYIVRLTQDEQNYSTKVIVE